MQTIGLHEKVNTVFITSVKEHEQVYIMLKKTGFNVSCEDLTPDNAGGYPCTKHRPEVIFTVHGISASDLLFIQDLLCKLF